MNFKEFITWLYEQDVEGNLKEDTKVKFFSFYGDVGKCDVKYIKLDEEGNIIISAR